jgi:hypothetical protein
VLGRPPQPHLEKERCAVVAQGRDPKG